MISVDISSFSPHIFWDIDISKINIETNKDIVIERALLYGLDKDEYLIFNTYEKTDIIDVVTNIKYIDKKICNYLSFRLDIPREDFICYKQKQWTENY
jgi:hypothetical protein